MSTNKIPNWHIMHDIETVSLKSNAAIISIGAVAIDLSKKRIEHKFYIVIDLASSLAAGLHQSEDVMQWWEHQSEEAREVFRSALTHSLASGLDRYTYWLNSFTDSNEPKPWMWANGSDFDNVVLQNAYEAIGGKAPWSFREHRCYRTLKAMYSNVLPPADIGTAHNALKDAMYQGEHLIRLLERAGYY